MEQEDSLKELHYACEKENAEKIEALIQKKGPEILKATFDVQDLKGGGALHYCAKYGKVKVLGILLSKECLGVDLEDNDGNTVLNVAAASGQVDALRVLLLNRKVKELINKCNKDRETALLQAVNSGSHIACEVLLREAKIDVRAKDAGGWEAIHLAAYDGNAKVVEVLLKHDKRLADATTVEGFTPLHVAAWEGQLSICKLLLQESSYFEFLSSKDCDGDTALFFAIYSGQIEVVEFFLEKLAGQESFLNHRNHEGETASHKAIAMSREGTAELHVAQTLMETKGINLDVKDNKGETLLHVACREGAYEIVEGLLQKKKELASESDSAGETALHEAARACRKDVVKRLLEVGLEPLKGGVLQRDGDGRTALHLVAAANAKENPEVCEASALEIVKLLLEYAGDNKELLLWASAGPVNGMTFEIADGLPAVKKHLHEEREKLYAKAVETPPHRGGGGWNFSHLIPRFFSPERQPLKSLLLKALEMGDLTSAREFINRGADISVLLQPLKDHPQHEEGLCWRRDASRRLLGLCWRRDASRRLLGRMDLAKGIAALLLNPSTGTPITIGIMGKWGLGKSSTMLQVESILLLTITQRLLMKPEKTNWFPGLKIWELTKEGQRLRGKIAKVIRKSSFDKENLHNNSATSSKRKEARQSSQELADDDIILEEFFEKDWQNHLMTLKGLALADRKEWLKDQHYEKTCEVRGEIPAVLTVHYNAWLYESQEEASAGLALEVMRMMEAHMTTAQWLQTCCFHAWKRNRAFIYQKIIFPSILLAILGGFIIWFAQKLLSSSNRRSGLNAFYYGSIPLGVILILWTVLRNIFAALQPISERLVGYKIQKEYEAKLGYRQGVIEDIVFLKEQLCKKPVFGWKLLGSCWKLFGENKDYIPGSLKIPRQTPPGDNLRVVVFIDDLDRCKQDKYVLEVLRAINLILSECKINVVLGVDKEMVEKAIQSEFKNDGSDLAAKFLGKIVQLPLDLPEPSDEEMKKFLREIFHDNQSASLQTKENSPSIRESAEQGKGSEVAIELGDQRDPGPIPEIQNTCKGRSQTSSSDPSHNMKKDSRGTNAEAGNTAKGKSLTSTSDLVQNTGSVAISKNPHAIEFPVLFASYNQIERSTLEHLVSCSSNHPRGWKCFLNYHRFVWNIVSESQFKELTDVDGWKRELIVWLFVCWRWKRQMNKIIEKWDAILSQKEKEIQDNKEEDRQKEEAKLKKERQAQPEEQQPQRQAGESSVTVEEKTKNALSSLRKVVKLYMSSKEGEEVPKQDEKGEWESFSKTLSKEYDVSMRAIQVFQRYRFNCNPGHLRAPFAPSIISRT